MKHIYTGGSGLMLAITLAAIIPGTAVASQEDSAIQLCKSKIEDVYGVDNFRNVWTERLGNHKFRVHGKVRYDNHKYDFNCKIKNGNVKSFAYDGPHDRYDEKDDNHSDAKTALAVGAGLAIIAALAASQSGKSDQGDRQGKLSVSKSVLEDECHDMLQYRIRDEHDYTASVTLKNSRIDDHDLVGDAKIRYDREHPHHASFTCHFDTRGRVMDSSYHLY